MIIKVKVNKTGSISDYINLPVLDKTVKGFGFFADKNDITKAIGIITDAEEVDGKYELTATIWDRFVEQNLELYDSKKVAAISFSIKQSK